ncbi:uncharacterized protein LOC126474235 [Schistocerca serialis cubense]|uniref:uncharacterized protein LOC126474235 n=1 Tax=Schistocerca serialis cubense TaxID=2023355 RepID=UPI00214EFF7F|nr:uncharacterized protein LOC126474235 [Schistocerca serialis cubense]
MTADTSHMRKARRKYVKNNMEEARQEFHGNRYKELYRKVKSFKGGTYHQHKLKIDANGRMLTEDQNIGRRWGEYFTELLNSDEPAELLEFDDPVTVDPEYPPPTIEEIRNQIKNIKNGKSPGEDRISSELLKAGSEILCFKTHKLIEQIWAKHEIPGEWKEAQRCDDSGIAVKKSE